MATLTYFLGRGLAEIPRWMLAATNEPFVNKGLRTPEELDALRASGVLAMNQLALLEIDGFNIVQSGAMVRYLARKHGVDGGTVKQKLDADVAFDSVRDFAALANSFPFDNRTEAGRVEYAKKFDLMTAKYLPRFQRLIELNPDSDTFLVQSTFTFADVGLAQVLHMLGDIKGNFEFLAPYPALCKLLEAVTSLPGVAAYLKSDLHYPLGDEAYCVNVDTVLRR